MGMREWIVASGEYIIEHLMYKIEIVVSTHIPSVQLSWNENNIIRRSAIVESDLLAQSEM